MLSLPTLTAADFTPLWPALLLCIGACIILLSEVFLSSASRTFQAPLAVGTTVLAGVVAGIIAFSAPTETFLGFVALDPFGSLTTLVICLGVGFAALLAPAFLRDRHAERGEFYALLLFGGAGMSLLVFSNELIFLFINLEILSVATYALASYLRRGPPRRDSSTSSSAPSPPRCSSTGQRFCSVPPGARCCRRWGPSWRGSSPIRRWPTGVRWPTAALLSSERDSASRSPRSRSTCGRPTSTRA